MLPTRINLLSSKHAIPDIDSMVNSMPYYPSNLETYTLNTVPIRLFWISRKLEDNRFEIIRLIAELYDGKVLDMVTSSDKPLEVKDILERAGIKYYNVEWDSTRSSDESNKTANLNSTGRNSVSDNWLARFGRWFYAFFFR